jgi:hypothetical protein
MNHFIMSKTTSQEAKMKTDQKARLAGALALLFLFTITACTARSFNGPLKIDGLTDITPGELGSWQKPVKCHLPSGERAYLDRLRGPDGLPVSYERIGSHGKGVYGNIVDGYVVISQDDSVGCIIYMDMYFSGYAETEAVDNFTIVSGNL